MKRLLLVFCLLSMIALSGCNGSGGQSSDTNFLERFRDAMNQISQNNAQMSQGQQIQVIPVGGMVSQQVIESQIDGDFKGWDGETIFKLTNGQIWQQSSYAYMYHYAYGPEVTIYEANGRFKMKVEGVEDTIEVVRIR